MGICTLFRSIFLSHTIDPLFYLYYTLTHAFHSRPDQPQPQSQQDKAVLLWFFVYFTLTHAFHSRPDQSQPESPPDTVSAVVVLCVFYFDSCFHSRPDQSQPEYPRDTVSAVVVLCVFYFDSCFSFQTRPVTTRVSTIYSQRCCGSLCILLLLMLFIPDQTNHNQSIHDIQSALLWFFVYLTLTHAFHSRPDQSQPEYSRYTVGAVVVLCVFYFNWCFSFQTRPVTTRVSTINSQHRCGSLCILLWLMLSFQTRPVTTRVPTRYNQRWCDFVDFYPTHYSTCGRLYVLRHPSSRKRVYLPHVDASHSGRHSCRYFCCTIT